MALRWVPINGGSLPTNAVSGGSGVCVARAKHEGGLLPGKIVHSDRFAYVCWNRKETRKAQYEVLTGTWYKWVPASNGNIPSHALYGGHSLTGETLYVGRGYHNNRLICGKVQSSHKCLYVPYNHGEITIRNYEVLCQTIRSRWVQTNSHSKIPNNAHIGGKDIDGDLTYIGRAIHEGDQLPAKVVELNRIASVCYDGEEIPIYNFEILCEGSYLKWEKSDNGAIPSFAITGGRTKSGQILYIGRGRFKESLLIGRVDPTNKILYVPIGGSEVAIRSYEILVEP